jgi:hypothetical protein
MHNARKASFGILFLSSAEPVIHCFHHFVYFTFTQCCWHCIFFTKLWWLFFHSVCYFAEVLQTNDLLNREHFSHALTYCVCDTTCNWASVLMFQCRYDNATLSLTCLAIGMLYFPMLGKLIKGTVWIWGSDT